jgi:hypothetical protein
LFLPIVRLATHAALTFVVAASNLADDFLMLMTHNRLLDSSGSGEGVGFGGHNTSATDRRMTMEFWGAAA